MKKRWTLTLSVFILLLICIQSYALAPGIKPCFPDIVVGNTEDNVGLTIDLGFYQYPDAMDLDDYVIDWDTPKDQLKWSFIEEQDGDSWIEINGFTQLASAGDAINPPADKELRSINNIITIRDLQASPHAQDPGPYNGPLTVNRMITLFVSDGTNVDHKTFLISSVAGAVDQLILTPIAPTDQYEFTNPAPDPLGWGFLQLTAEASGDISDKGLRITTQESPEFEVGIWSSPNISPTPNKLYLAKYYVSTDQSEIEKVPDFRMRWGTARQDNCSTLRYTNTGTRANVLASQIQTFNIYFEPVVPGDLYLAFDSLSTPGESGDIYAFQVDVTTIDIPTSPGIQLISYQPGDFDGWTTGNGTTVSKPSFERTPQGTIMIGSSTEAIDTFGFWQSPSTNLEYIPTKLFKANFGLKSPDDSSRNLIPEIRLRVQAEDHQFTATQELYPDGDGIAMPTEAGNNYNVWFETPNVKDNPDAGQDGFITALDILDINDVLGGSIELFSLDVEYYDQPCF